MSFSIDACMYVITKSTCLRLQLRRMAMSISKHIENQLFTSYHCFPLCKFNQDLYLVTWFVMKSHLHGPCRGHYFYAWWYVRPWNQFQIFSLMLLFTSFMMALTNVTESPCLRAWCRYITYPIILAWKALGWCMNFESVVMTCIVVISEENWYIVINAGCHGFGKVPRKALLNGTYIAPDIVCCPHLDLLWNAWAWLKTFGSGASSTEAGSDYNVG